MMNANEFIQFLVDTFEFNADALNTKPTNFDKFTTEWAWDQTNVDHSEYNRVLGKLDEMFYNMDDPDNKYRQIFDHLQAAFKIARDIKLEEAAKIQEEKLAAKEQKIAELEAELEKLKAEK